MSAVAVHSAALTDSKVETKHELSKDNSDDDPNKTLAFLPNLVPTYMTETDDGVRVGMFSLFHQVPDVSQGWRIMLRGLHLPKLLVCSQTIEFLEKCGRAGGVEWKPLPPNNNQGSAGIVFDFARFDDPDEVLSAMCATLSLVNQSESGVGDENGDSKETEPINSASEVSTDISTDIEPFDESDSDEAGADGSGGDGGPATVLTSSDSGREVQGGAEGAAQ